MYNCQLKLKKRFGDRGLGQIHGICLHVIYVQVECCEKLCFLCQSYLYFKLRYDTFNFKHLVNSDLSIVIACFVMNCIFLVPA